mmetsp:Transcript_57561/g.114272  ORF Transcript_57561/g.114272 Transcript_57561/m.114272 type:complete len:87 (+) Transcript_57561:240-500(+)
MTCILAAFARSSYASIGPSDGAYDERMENEEATSPGKSGASMTVLPGMLERPWEYTSDDASGNPITISPAALEVVGEHLRGGGSSL